MSQRTNCSSKYFPGSLRYKGVKKKKRKVFPVYSVKKVVTYSRSLSGKASTKTNFVKY